MKSLVLALIVMIFFSCSAQKELVQTESISQFEKACLHLLDNGHPGVIENALFLLLHYDILNANEINYQIRERIVYLAENGETKKIRDRALIISDYLNTDDDFLKVIIRAEYLDREKLFEIVDSHIKKKELIANTMYNK